jgi:hypothetical protein
MSQNEIADRAAALPGRYFALIQSELALVAQRLVAEPNADLAALETGPQGRHFPGAILAAAVLYACRHPANPGFGDPDTLALALQIGDLLVRENARGAFTARLDHHRDTYAWLEACRLLEKELGDARRAEWRRELEKNVEALAADVAEREDYPRYQAPFLYTSPNHYSLWASTVHLAGRVFGGAGWERLGARVMHRFVTEEQAPDGYWGEHDDSGPTTGYNYLSVTAAALYAEQSGDPEALQALRRATDFHIAFTYPDGMPVEVINDRNRHWSVNAWGHFGFSQFPNGRRYAAFLTRFFRDGEIGYETMGRLAQNALYYHEGPAEAIFQEMPDHAHRMTVPAGIRRTGPWTVCLSGLISTQSVTNQFFLDRQGHLSVFHEGPGLIVTGANSKRQPELATFAETIAGQVHHLPLSSRLRMGEARDRLGLAYNTFFAELEVARPAADRMEFRFHIVERGQAEAAQLTLQLVLKPGEALETGSSRIVPGEERIELGPEELGGLIRHNGWTLQTDPTARLIWPIHPFSPYANGPETTLRYAVAALSVPLNLQVRPDASTRFRTQVISFTLEVNPTAEKEA